MDVFNVLVVGQNVNNNFLKKEKMKEKNVILKIKKINDKAIIPAYQTSGSAGFDLHAIIVNEKNSMGEKIDYIVIPPKNQQIIDTGLSCAVPLGYEMQIRPRSGLAFKNKITVTNSPGTIDSDYRGEIKVILYNLGEQSFIVKDGDRIAQAVISPIIVVEIEEVEVLDETERGDGGFGSTGHR
jgi:dUTP pyrophosphatase